MRAEALVIVDERQHAPGRGRHPSGALVVMRQWAEVVIGHVLTRSRLPAVTLALALVPQRTPESQCCCECR